ncbi:MAG: EAL domain-containing protein [Actinobacteria bacterium]|nr:EAL domain-containing protein [Actinomycetota bacterium]
MAEHLSWHRLLQRQARRVGLTSEVIDNEPALTELLDLVSNSYEDADQHRYLSDRAFEVSGREMLDLNEQLRLAGETELAHQHGQLQAVFDSVAIGLVVVDADGIIVELNSSARAMLHVEDAAENFPLRTVLGPMTSDSQNDRTFTSLIRSVSRGIPWRGADIMLRVGEDHTFPGSVAFNPLFDNDLPAGGVLAITDVTERHSAASELAWRATHDALTGLLNRTALIDRLNRIVSSEAARHPSEGPDSNAAVGVLFIDLDRFKLVNDTLGHAAGDDLLTIVVERIRKVMREGDTLARLGGDEFIILCEGVADGDVAMHLADRVVTTLAQPVGLGMEQAYISASIGVTMSDATSDATSLLRDADVALYRAKSLGRGRAVMFNEAMRDEVADRVRMERDLRTALDDDALSVAFQPAESPAIFIALAEDTGLIGRLGSIVLDQAGLFLERLEDAGTQDLTVSVNLSPLRLADQATMQDISAILQRTTLPADRLMLEITESALLGAPETSREHLEKLRSLGVRIALDDFGTGYSSLSTLRAFPLDALKIDRSFVSDLTTDHGDRTIVSAILGHALGMRIVAEGAETMEQVTAVRELGCDRVQGYVLGMPLQPDEAYLLAMSPRGALWDQDGPRVSAPVLATGK